MAADGEAPSTCPLEAAAYLCLAYRDQAEALEGMRSGDSGAPSGPLTLAPSGPCPAEDLPRGFYLRRLEGVLWLRGFRADDLHVWDAEDTFAFCRKA